MDEILPIFFSQQFIFMESDFRGPLETHKIREK